MSSTISLKVTVPGDQQKAFRVSLTIPISEVTADIQQKIGFNSNDHGLFQPEVPHKSKARWLIPSYTLNFYQLPPDAHVILQKIHRPLRVETLDKAVKTVMINDTHKVKDIRDEIGNKFSIANAEEYGLRVKGAKEGVWLNIALGLYEQDVTPAMILIFDKNYYFSDDQVDLSDPHQLHLIYTKAVTSIITGQYPVTLPEACSLAGVQAQAIYGVFQSQKHSVGFLRLQDMLPVQWLTHKKFKLKQIEAMVISEWGKLGNLSDVQSKYKYVSITRKLPTYGITFYTVKTPNPNGKRDAKNALIPLLVGVTKEKILRMNYETKQIEKEYLLIHLKRWASLRGKFTFDWGDHEDSFWTVFTEQGDAMSELIAGYIDIIINNRRAMLNRAPEPEHGAIAQVEDYSGVASTAYAVAHVAAPQTATHVQTPLIHPTHVEANHAPAVFTDTQMVGVQGQYVSPERASSYNLETIEDALRTAHTLYEEASKPKIARATDRRISSVSPTQLVEALIQYEKQIDNDVEILVHAIATKDKAKVNKVSNDIIAKAKLFNTTAEQAAKLSEHGGLMSAPVLGVIGAIRDLISVGNEFGKSDYEDLAFLNAQKKAYDDSMLLMQSAQEGNFNDKATAALIAGLVKDLAVNVDDLIEVAVVGAGGFPQGSPDAQLMGNFIKQVQQASGSLTASAGTLSQAVIDDRTKEYLGESANFLKNLVEGLQRASTRTGDALPRIERKVQNVDRALDRLMEALETGDSVMFDNDVARQFEIVQQNNPILQDTNSGQKQLLDGLKTVATAANEIVKQSLAYAPSMANPMAGKQLERSAITTKDLLTNGLTAVGKQAVRAPTNPQFRQQLDASSRETEKKLGELVGMVLGANNDAALRMAAKHVLGALYALQAAVQEAGAQAIPFQKLHEENAPLRVALGEMLSSVAYAAHHPQKEAQEKVINAFKNVLPLASKELAAIARTPTAGVKPETVSTVNTAKTDASNALQAMMAACQRYDSVDANNANTAEAQKAIANNNAALDTALFTAQSGFLTPLDSQGYEVALENLKGFSENMQELAGALVKTVHQGGDISQGAKSIADSASDLISLGEGLAGCLDPEAQLRFLEALRRLNDGTGAFIDACKNARLAKNDKTIADMDLAKKDLTKILCEALSAAKGVDNSQLAQVLSDLRNEQNQLRPVKKEGLDYPSALKQLAARGKAVEFAGKQLMETAQRAPQRVLQQSRAMDAAAKQLVAAANAAAGACSDPVMSRKLIELTRQVLGDATTVVETVNNGVTNGDFYPAEEALDQLGASVAHLQNATSGSMYPEIDRAISAITDAQGILNDPRVPPLNAGQVLQKVGDAVADLTENTDRLATAAAVGTDKVNIYAKETANAVKDLLTAAAGAVAGSKAAPAGGSDIQQYLAACAKIIADPSKTNEVGPAAMTIGQLTKAFAASARDDAIALGADKDRQKNFIAASKSMGAGLPQLVGAIKAGNGPLIKKTAEFLHNAATVMEAAKTGQDQSSQPVPPKIAEALKIVSDRAAEATKKFLAASNDLASSPGNALLAETLADTNNALQQELTKVNEIMRALDPALQAVKKTSSIISGAIGDLELALVNLEVGVSLGAASKTKAEAQNDLVELLQALAPEIKNFSPDATQKELVSAADHLALQIPQIVDASSCLASHSAANAKRLLQQAKNLALSMQKLANECYISGPNTGKFQGEATSAVGEMLGGLKASTELFSELDTIISKIVQLVDVMNQNAPPSGKPFSIIKDDVTDQMRTLMGACVALKTCDLSSIATISVQAKAIGRCLPAVISAARDATATVSDGQAKNIIRGSAQTVIQALVGLFQQAKEVALEDDLGNRADFDDKWNEFTSSAGKLLSSLQLGSLGEGKINAGNQLVSNTINKLNSCAIYVSCGQDLEDVEKTTLAPAALTQKLMQQAAVLQSSASSVSASAPKTADVLGVEVEKFSQMVAGLCETTLQIVEKETDNEKQATMINAAKATAISGKQLIIAASALQKNPGDSTAQATLANAVAMFPRAVTTFTSVVKGDNQSNTALDQIKANILKVPTLNQSTAGANALALVESARSITKAATPLVMGSSHSDLVKGAEDALGSVQVLVASINGANVPTPALKATLQQNGKDVCVKLADLVDAANGNRLDPLTHDKISAASLGLTQSLDGLVKTVNQLPGGAGLTLFGSQKDQLTTSSALEDAADAIKRALASLPVRRIGQDQMDVAQIANMNELNDVLVAHARTIAEATFSLVKHAGEAERESNHTAAKERYNKDATWANGLISASHKVADVVTWMIEAANAALNGQLEEEKLIANAKEVAVAVKQLVVASNVRGISTKLTMDIGDSAKSVARGTADIVATAQRAGEVKAQNEAPKKRFGGPGANSMIQRIEQQAQILRLEKQLQEARKGLGNINQADYK